MKYFSSIFYFICFSFILTSTSCTSDHLEKDTLKKQISSFEINKIQGVIDQEENTITVIIPPDTYLEYLTPIIEISDNTTISPRSGEMIDFTNPVYYTVTAQDKSTRTYKINVKNDVSKITSITSSSNNIESLYIDEKKIEASLNLNYESSLITVVVEANIDMDASIDDRDETRIKLVSKTREGNFITFVFDTPENKTYDINIFSLSLTYDTLMGDGSLSPSRYSQITFMKSGHPFIVEGSVESVIRLNHNAHTSKLFIIRSLKWQYFEIEGEDWIELEKLYVDSYSREYEISVSENTTGKQRTGKIFILIGQGEGNEPLIAQEIEIIQD